MFFSMVSNVTENMTYLNPNFVSSYLKFLIPGENELFNAVLCNGLFVMQKYIAL